MQPGSDEYVIVVIPLSSARIVLAKLRRMNRQVDEPIQTVPAGV